MVYLVTFIFYSFLFPPFAILRFREIGGKNLSINAKLTSFIGYLSKLIL